VGIEELSFSGELLCAKLDAFEASVEFWMGSFSSMKAVSTEVFG